MNWSKGFSVSHYASVVDSISWKDTDRIEIESGSINKTDSALLQSADLTCESNNDAANFDREKWIRIYADVRQEDGSYHGPLFTGLVCSPSQQYNGNYIANQLQCYSVLKPADDILLQRGWYAAAKSEATKLVKDLLAVTPAPVTIEGVSGEIVENIIAEDGETNLSMVWKILDMMNWNLDINGKGEIIISTYPTILDTKVLFDPIDNDAIETNISINFDWFDCPNVFRAISGTSIAVSRDEDDDSPLSIQNRGREVWMEELHANLNTNESLGEYARRKLREYQNVAYTISYNRRYHPDINMLDIIQMNYPAQNITGYFRVTNQNISLGHGITVSEEAVKV